MARFLQSAVSQRGQRNQQGNFNLFSQHCSIEVVKTQEQVGGKDCGLFAIGSATALCFGQNPAVIVFDQDKN